MKRDVSGVFRFGNPKVLHQDLFWLDIFDPRLADTSYAHIISRYIIDHPHGCIQGDIARDEGQIYTHKNTSARIASILYGQHSSHPRKRDHIIWNTYDLHEEFGKFAQERPYDPGEQLLEKFLDMLRSRGVKLPCVLLGDLLRMSYRVGEQRQTYEIERLRLSQYDPNLSEKYLIDPIDMSYYLSRKGAANVMLWMLADPYETLARFFSHHTPQELLEFGEKIPLSGVTHRAWSAMISSLIRELPIKAADMKWMFDQYFGVIPRDQILFALYQRPEVPPVGVDLESYPGYIVVYLRDPYTSDQSVPIVQSKAGGVYICANSVAEELGEAYVQDAHVRITHERLYGSLDQDTDIDETWGYFRVRLAASCRSGLESGVEEMLTMLTSSQYYWRFLDAYMRVTYLAQEGSSDLIERIESVVLMSDDHCDFIARVDQELGYLYPVPYADTLRGGPPATEEHVHEMMRMFFYLHPQILQIAYPWGVYPRIPTKHI